VEAGWNRDSGTRWCEGEEEETEEEVRRCIGWSFVIGRVWGLVRRCDLGESGDWLRLALEAWMNSYLTNYGQNVQLWTFGVTMVTFMYMIV
jgi:hypothetical protein